MAVKAGWVGRFLEDFEVGDIYRCRLGRTITESDNIQFTLITNNTNQIHFNTHYASRTPFKRPLVNSALTLAVVAGLGVADVSENGFALGWDYIKLPNPVFPGDTLYSESDSAFVNPRRVPNRAWSRCARGASIRTARSSSSTNGLSWSGRRRTHPCSRCFPNRSKAENCGTEMAAVRCWNRFIDNCFSIVFRHMRKI